ncbi:acyltransferase [Flavobacterium succinicans]|uniref:dTDP-3-amino-3,6-dideoxy-alpha-D-galactopyranose 3-N-acetyltransferase n=1 Tax=Flavobacterium succinicans TaxID=29536 RepID=A0A199XN74_9FLAO|nr:acyltransferase [Flavobacterium succinicans]OAZ03100.1 dTDP-3-amino-3,6-dideoxy-alpha-D-galactopyranose 3-N-acetyltransferase [Flavobacterium succinicans]
MQMIINYLKLIPRLFYFIFNVLNYNFLSLRSIVFFSVRVQGKKYISIGRNSVVQRGGWLLALKIDNENPILSIGDNCAIGDYCHVISVRKVVFENDVLVANNVYISDNLHDYENINIPIKDQAVKFKREVVLQSGCWIGENVCIIGASVGKNSVIGANSVVTSDIGDYCIAVGSPAKVIKKYDLKSEKWLTVNANN